MISETGMRDLTVGQRLVWAGTGNAPTTWVIDAIDPSNDSAQITRLSESLSLAKVATVDLASVARHCTLAIPSERIFEGLYRHRVAGPDDIYYVKGVGILDEDGHGDPDAPRQVFYESTRSRCPARREATARRDGVDIREDAHDVYLGNIRIEAEFGQLVTWPDGVVRPRFVRIGYSK